MHLRAHDPGDRSRVFATVALAAAGVLVGHELTYLVIRPDASARGALLAETGHGYLQVAIQVVWAIGVLALSSAFLGRLVARRPGAPLPRIGHLARSLFGVQLTAFFGLEVAERMVAGSFADLLPVVLVGALAQLGVAVVLAFLLRRWLQMADRAALVAAGTAPNVVHGTTRLILPVATLVAASQPPAGFIRGPPSR
jgi:hypothetical protein